jgi:hypothetical protein
MNRFCSTTVGEKPFLNFPGNSRHAGGRVELDHQIGREDLLRIDSVG